LQPADIPFVGCLFFYALAYIDAHFFIINYLWKGMIIHMKYPEFLSEHGTIGFVAPSFGCSTEPYRSAFDHALEKFKAMGHTLDLGPNCYASAGIGISNTPEACGDELTKGYLSIKNDVLISCGGGELMCETLNYTDFAQIAKAKPKWYMGYSDNTNMTYLLTTLCDTASIYGPCACNFGMEPWHDAITDAYELLRGNKLTITGYDKWEWEDLKSPELPLEPYNTEKPRQLIVFEPDKAAAGIHAADAQTHMKLEGRLLGGCMDCLVNLLGTKFDKTADFVDNYKKDGILWFFESCDLNVMSIRRAIWQMKNAGWFSHVKGFLIGRPAVFGQEMMGLDQYHAVCDLLAEYHVPIIMDADLGHLPPMMPIICGSYGKLSLQGNDISLTYELK
jgi:muramoyltetrapeptide carboxypeptidase LdcA involved in peptidoglycan recycling